ncbi:cytochrome d ubiquinol oxidase subunit II [Methyloversatilis sp.]|uniref:cytochrome d ubiquinol oxidase subunit II n=1 Tax=Methyloversatilis sp. TaxID=2569862 RepID=UPI0027334593|nr:cytochrome d ubiquinol oxidase subunit II [Methyloversatilis sp.]MDP2868512.1 cytochrome d ubiquinol oxidase subunit II [Methyloversatilis sp.]MDP3288625.1 cytochrome d ubiquinol oxidase subunit II [Methyloversatilis sp.]MDP3455120.1 cytochrome d ubiquinol oxidase subunit II [Methyloversatilis sp.]MDP3579631.1 cytochrome d ubiquinol oxidase subunit II [Methyloversatilis sp.]
MTWAEFLPVIFMGLMGLSMFLYVVLDGFDLGVGMLLHRADDSQKDMMIASIGPFWDANETWLVLGVGILLIAFPKAHGVVMTALYLPIALMLIGLILRGVAFDFRVKAQDTHKPLWNRGFFIGSTVTSVAQGWMLGRFITGFAEGTAYDLFALAIAIALPCAYVLMGASWLVLKTDGELQRRAAQWGRTALIPVIIGMGLISLATPWVSSTVAERWFSLPQLIGLLPIPFATFACFVALWWTLSGARALGTLCWLPFILTIGVFLMGGLGLAYSLYPYVVMDRITIWQAASSTAALNLILAGCAFTVPAILGYTLFAHRVFWGKATELRYG